MKPRTVNPALRLFLSIVCILTTMPVNAYPQVANSLASNAPEIPRSPAVESIYQNFIGKWEGYSERLIGGRPVTESVEIVITEEPKKHRMKLDYLYHGENGTTSRRRFLQLDPAKEKMKLVDEGLASDQYDVSGLKQFAQTGLGDFAAIRRDGSEMTRVIFHLGLGTLNYEWAGASDGKTYETWSRFSFRRKP